MGGARKLGNSRGGQGPGARHRDNRPNRKKCSGVQKHSPWSRVKRAKPPSSEAETLLAFGRATEAANFLVFLIFGSAKNYRCM